MKRDFMCPMCGWSNVTVRFLEAEKSKLVDKKDRLVCKCERCDYKWHEETNRQRAYGE